MDLIKIYKKAGMPTLALMLLMLVGCTVSYKLTGASIDYTKVKTISMETFQNRAAYQWGPMAQMFNQTLNDVFVQQTKLVQVKNGGDLHLAGEILDVTGDCGGFNLHWAWCSGIRAGQAAAKAVQV